jgi:hypothetical protein
VLKRFLERKTAFLAEAGEPTVRAPNETTDPVPVRRIRNEKRDLENWMWLLALAYKTTDANSHHPKNQVSTGTKPSDISFHDQDGWIRHQTAGDRQHLLFAAPSVPAIWRRRSASRGSRLKTQLRRSA